MMKQMERVFHMTSQTDAYGKPEGNFFVYDCGTPYSNCHLVIFTTKLTMLKVQT